MVFSGVDWADDHHDCVVLDALGQMICQFRVTHSTKGLAELVQRLSALADPHQVACVIETRHGILVNTLLEAGFCVYPVNPKTVDRHRSASGAKTDAIDAFILARYGLHEIDRLRKLEPDNPIIQELKQLTRDQASLIQQKTRLTNQLTACLKEYYPCALEFFCSLNRKVALAFLANHPTLEHVLAAEPSQLAEFLKHHKHPRPNLVAQKIIEIAHAAPLRTNAITTRTKARLMLAIVSQLTPLVEAISAYDKETERLFVSHSDSAIFRSLPGAGMRLAPRLLAEWGDDRNRYAGCESVAALAGTSPVPFQSGRFRKARKRFACVKQFRDALYKLAWLSSQVEPWANQYYRRKHLEGKSHSVALRALSNVWVRIIHGMWLNRTTYSRQVFEAAQTRHRRVA